MDCFICAAVKILFFLVSVQTKQRGPNINLIFCIAVQT